MALAKPLGAYMARVYEGEPRLLGRVLGPLERAASTGSRGVDADEEMTWKTLRRRACCVFNLARLRSSSTRCSGCRACCRSTRRARPAVTPDSSFNTAVSFATNTNWQGYGGETTMSYLTQMLGLTVQNFVSAATGMAVLVALIRGFARTHAPDDRQLLGRPDAQHALHPAAAVARAGAGAGLAGRGADLRAVRDGRRCSSRRTTPTATPSTSRRSPMGPAASQIAIKQLGTNGGGFFNVNSAHPFENPTPLSQLPRDAGDPADPGGAVLHVRRDGRRHAAGLGGARGDARRSSSRCWSSASWPSRRAIPRSPRSGVDQTAERAAVRRQHGRQGGALRHRQLGALGHRHHRRLERLRSTRCTTRSRRSAGWCRCG